MPSPTDFKRAFQLDKVDGTKKVSVGHVVKKQNELYTFPVKMIFDSAADLTVDHVQQVLTEKKTLFDGCVVYSAFGSPYECELGAWKVESGKGGAIEATSTGTATRNRDMLTQRQQSDLKRADTVDLFKLLSKEEKKGFSFRKSAYSSSKCSSCNEKIDIGARIVKKKSSKKKRGGWSHIECEPAFAKRKSTLQDVSEDDIPIAELAKKKKKKRRKKK